MRCPDCNKFASMDPGEPEVQDESIDTDGMLCVTVQITLNCAECGTTLKETSQEVSVSLDAAIRALPTYANHFDEQGAPKGDDCGLEVAVGDCSSTEQQKGRKTSYGAEGEAVITCSCQQDAAFTLSHHFETDMTPSSQMDEVC